MSHAQPAGRGRNRPALRLVETKSLSREDWLEVRKNGIGGSDAKPYRDIRDGPGSVAFRFPTLQRRLFLQRHLAGELSYGLEFFRPLRPALPRYAAFRLVNCLMNCLAYASSRPNQSTPKASRFSLAKKRYLSRQYFPPDGETSRYMPPPSAKR